MVRDKSLCSSWDKKMNARRQKELVKQYSLQLKEEKARQKEVTYSAVRRLNVCDIKAYAPFSFCFLVL